MSSYSWVDLPKALGGDSTLSKLNEALKSDKQYVAFTNTEAISQPITFAIASAGNEGSSILVTVERSKGQAQAGSAKSNTLFTLAALPEQWEQFFQRVPKPPYQSYWGMLGMNIKQQGVAVAGDQTEFARYTHVWRRVLELLREAVNGESPLPEDEGPDEANDDFITGRYVYVDVPVWGKCKVFVEHAGDGRQPIVFLHTAGSDSRQYHGVMNDRKMRTKCTMYAFDLPGHGRSFPAQNYVPGKHSNTEDSYVGCIAAVIKRLGLKRPIVCGASMAGQVCLAVASRNDEVGSGGVIPLQGADYLDMQRQWHDQSPVVNQSLFNPEWVYGMMAPTTPAVNKALLWHLYSAQAYGIFHGDLDFYFGGWDGRSRMASINTANCPVYMLTGEYDWSNTPEMSQATADKIPGAVHKKMEGLGHFPATENPKRFIPYLIEAIDFIQKARKGSVDRSVLRMTDD